MKKILASISLISLAIPVFALAQPSIDTQKWKNVDIWSALDTVTNYIFWLVIMAAVIFIIVAGYNFITAAGEPEKIKTAQRMVLYALIGVLVVFLAWGLVKLVEGVLGGGGGKEEKEEQATSCSDYCRKQGLETIGCSSDCGSAGGRHFPGGDKFCPSITALQCCCL